VEIDPPLRPDGRQRGGERRGEPGLADDQRLCRVRELFELLAVVRTHRRFGATFQCDPFRGLARDLPVDRSFGLQQAHDLSEVDLREVDLRRVEFTTRVAEEKARKAGNGSVLGLFGVSRLRRIGHAVSVWGCIP
jgi:hypothetical protein